MHSVIRWSMIERIPITSREDQVFFEPDGYCEYQCLKSLSEMIKQGQKYMPDNVINALIEAYNQLEKHYKGGDNGLSH